MLKVHIPLLLIYSLSRAWNEGPSKGLYEFHIYLPWVNVCLAYSVLNVKALVGAFNQEKALVGALLVIAKSSRIFE